MFQKLVPKYSTNIVSPVHKYFTFPLYKKLFQTFSLTIGRESLDGNEDL